MITSSIRGHKTVCVDGHWSFEDTGEPVRDGDGKFTRPCAECGCYPTPEGYDPCLRHIPGAIHACCGHGIQKGYIMWKNREVTKI